MMQIDDGGSFSCMDSKYCYGKYETAFQLLPVFDTFYFDLAAEEGYTGFSTSGETNTNTNVTNKITEAKPKSSLVTVAMNALQLVNDGLTAFRPLYYKTQTQYDQKVSIKLRTTYTNTPNVNAKRTLRVDEMTITNNSKIPMNMNYMVTIWGSGQVIESLLQVAPGETSSVPFEPFEMGYRGVNVIINAMTGCFGSCVRLENPPIYRGYVEFHIFP